MEAESHSNAVVDPALDDRKRDIGSTGTTAGTPDINPITKRIKLFNGGLASTEGISDDDDDDDVLGDDLDLELEIPSDSQQHLADKSHIPSDSELLKKNEALQNYTNFVQSSSTTPHSQNSLYTALATIPLNLPAPEYLPPNIQLLINTIPSLDNLATQILRVIVQNPYQKILDLVANPETLPGMTYQTLISLFDNIKTMYSSEDPFLSVEHLTFGLWKEGSTAPTFLRGNEDTIQSTLRKVNLATFLNATLGTIDTGFFYLNEFFLDVFCPDQVLNPAQTITNLSSAAANTYDVSVLSSHSGSTQQGKLLKSQTVLYLELKTQAYISALEAHERSRDDILDDIFPEDLSDVLLKRKTRFLNTYTRDTPTLSPSELDFVNRCKKRKQILLQASSDTNLSEQYDWLTFLKDFFEFARKNIGYLVWGSKNVGELIVASKLKDKKLGEGKLHTSATTSVAPHSPSLPLSATSPAVAGAQNTEYKYDPDSLPSEIVQAHRESRLNTPSGVRSLNRRLWTKSEEHALKEALQLKGPQWAQILEMYGAGGSVSEALKNRSQVQLKDKARNWKIFFLKNGLPLPDYLKKVTGDLESHKSALKKTKRRDAKKGSRPPRIEQKHVDAANAAAEADAAAANKAKTAEIQVQDQQEKSEAQEVVEQKSEDVPSPAAKLSASGDDKVEKTGDEANLFAQTNSAPGVTESKEETSKPDDDNSAPTEAVPASVSIQQDQQNHEEVPDYDNILKDLIDQATTGGQEQESSSVNEGNDQAHEDEEEERKQADADVGHHVEDDVQRLVDEVINANSKKEDSSA